MIEIRAPRSDQEFKEYYHLRWKVLRKPWNQPEGSERDELDDSSFHIMATEYGAVIGCCRLQLNSKTEAQVRYMAVENNQQGKGTGKRMMQEAEKIAKESGAEILVLEARENAVPFYKQCGYKIIKKSYILFDEIQHYTMLKKLN